MAVLQWRNDSDGFAFVNNWTFDPAERAVLTGIAQSVVPGAVAAIAAIVPDPILITAVAVAATAAAAYPAAGPLPTYGMCGGMAYASLDYWHAKMILPRGKNRADQPARTTPTATALRDLIWRRLLDSLTIGGVFQRTLEWSLLLNQVPAWAGGGGGALLSRTRVEWNMLRSLINAGQPCPIGLIYTNSDVWDQHQILAYGYEIDGSGNGKLYVYDNNAPKQYGDTGHDVVTLDFTGPALVATSPSDGSGTLAGFFCSNYVPNTPPAGLAESYGEFLSWTADPRTWMAVNGARMSVAGNAELNALGGTPTDVQATGSAFIPLVARPRDGSLFRERSAAPVYLYQGGCPFWVPDPTWLQRFGGWDATRVVPDNTINAFAGLPDEGTLLREWSDAKVYRIMAGTRRWVTSGIDQYGGFPSVRVVPDGELAAIPEGQVLPTPNPSECANLRRSIAALNTKIDNINKKLDNTQDPRQETKLENELQNDTKLLNQEKARAAVLNCP